MIHGDHLLGVTVDHDVRVVRDHDDLPPALVVTDLPNDEVVDHMVVKIVFRLIEYDGFIAVRK